MSNVSDNTLTFRTKESLEFTELDAWGKEGALGWGQGMRWGTVLMFLDFAMAIDKSMHLVDYPFLILHDPGDKVCDIEGSRKLVAESKTASEDKKLLEVRYKVQYSIPSSIVPFLAPNAHFAALVVFHILFLFFIL